MAAVDDSISTPAATPYFTIRPADVPLDPATVETHLRRLHGLATSAKGGFLTGAPRPIVEWLLTSTGDERGLTYAVGVDDEGAHSSLEHAIRGLFPDSYAIAEIDRETLLEPFATAEDADTVALAFEGNPTHRKDWQTCLTPFADFHESERDRNHVRAPLASVAETLAGSPLPICYQVLLRPKPDWSVEADERRLDLEQGSDTFGGELMNALVGPPPEDELVMLGVDEERVVHLRERDTHRSFEVNVRAVPGHSADPVDAESVLCDLALAFEAVSGPFYRVEGTVSTGSDAQQLVEALHDRTLHPPAYGRTLTSPGRRTSPGLVVDARELGSFCALPGDALTSAGVRGVGVTPSERTGLSLPPTDQLTPYSGAGMMLGLPLTDDDRATDEPLVLPPSLQPLHVGWFGRTGAGKSTALVNAMLANHRATDGASILVDPKGDGMGEAYLRAHFAEYGSLDDVCYFDCAAVLPAISFFDIRGELEAGIPRETAVEDAVDHYIEILRAIMGRDRFDQAVRSPDIIRYLVKALFDPVHGSDHFSHRQLHETARRMHERQSAPAVSDDDLERMLGGVVANRARTFDEIMQGVANRIEKVPVDRRLARLFNHVYDEESNGSHFDLVDFLDENVVIVFDTGGLRTEAQRVFALLILSELWTALKRRRKRAVTEDLPLVNLYIEEAASIAVSGLLQELLAQSRSFDCSVTLAMQFPAQLRGYDQDVYDEILNNVSTILTGNVPSDARFAQRLATDDMDPQQVGNRMRALRRGQWLVSLPAAFDRPEPRPFLVQSAPLPPGHPDGDRALSFDEQSALAAAQIDMQARTRAAYGLGLSSPSVVRDGPPVPQEAVGDGSAESATPSVRVDSALPHTKRMPPTVEYDGSIHALRCTQCDNRYDPSIDGMKRAIECCSSIDAVDSDDVPVCELNLKLTEAERLDSEWSDAQLMFLQAVYNAQQLRFDPLEYDLLWDSMIRLQEYVGIESDAVQDLIDADLLRHDTDRPHRLYTVSPEGRKVIGESYRQGVDYGHGQGDLEESSDHVLGVEIGRRYLEGKYRDDPESEVAEVIPYYDLGENQRLDIAGVDEEGGVVVAIEVERVNHDIKRAVPEDFDKMAACDPAEAIWIVMSHTEGHEVLAALNEPLEGEVRVEKTYAKTSPVSSFKISEPGLTAMYTVEQVREALGGKGPAA
ncbi:hypothetical protein DP107_07465 [Haloglomus irregulare]|mgnify:CR=1 FL=1|uniref:TraD/TraG TraM recognition site domain-containing protein n=1 Tax=Haloglomus irregulare TaxID=2234134 RepID=A0A554NBN4_9EURY|nr:TraM recognition domain-containing protein [Haloglomus irregulare]TSD14797.1 hypothetical protein DP107_07465 [Haloglomus irregulare]